METNDCSYCTRRRFPQSVLQPLKTEPRARRAPHNCVLHAAVQCQSKRQLVVRYFCTSSLAPVEDAAVSDVQSITAR